MLGFDFEYRSGFVLLGEVCVYIFLVIFGSLHRRMFLGHPLRSRAHTRTYTQYAPKRDTAIGFTIVWLSWDTASAPMLFDAAWAQAAARLRQINCRPRNARNMWGLLVQCKQVDSSWQMLVFHLMCDLWNICYNNQEIVLPSSVFLLGIIICWPSLNLKKSTPRADCGKFVDKIPFRKKKTQTGFGSIWLQPCMFKM